MAIPSSPSFIPKQPAVGKVKKRRVTRKIYVLTYVSFVFFFGTLIAAGGTFFYELSVKSQLEVQKQKLIEERKLFNQADFERVKEFDTKLISAKKVLDEHVSVLSILEALESSTVSTVQLMALEIDRTSNNSIALSLEAMSENFNSVIFQRKIFNSNPVLHGSELNGFSIMSAPKDEVELGLPEQFVTFSLAKDFSPSDIRYEPRSLDELLGNLNEEISVEDEGTEEATSTEDTDPTDPTDLSANEVAQ